MAATVDPKATLMRLIELQKLDSDVWRVRQRIADGPRLLERRSERLRQAEQKVAKTHERILDVKKQAGLLELEVKTREAEIAKIQAAQGQSRTNEEFRAYNDHANRLRKENRATEDRILECEQQVEDVKKELAEQERALEQLAAEAKENAALWAKDAAEYQAELDQMVARRAEYAKSLPPGPLSTYERVLKARDGKAIVSVEGGRTCGGCSMSITPNDMTRLHRMNEIVSCRSCERILYLPELATAAH
jgi:predicted  nucleic acid-binding Zn-ribbon protein